MIAIIDYGMGNLRSVQKAFEAVGERPVVTRDPGVISAASHVVLPGVGAFGDAMDHLHEFGLVDVIRRVIEGGKPFLGICLGLQVLFTESEEHGHHKGLNLVQGKVLRFPDRVMTRTVKGADEAVRLKVPHIGWNDLRLQRKAPVLRDVPEGSHVYFVHSYYVVPHDEELVATMTTYGLEFTSSIWKDNIFACQFHPEKSHDVGLKILKRFCGTS